MDKRIKYIIEKIRFKDAIVVSEEDRKASFAKIKERIAANEKVNIPFEQKQTTFTPTFLQIAAAVAFIVSISGVGFNIYFNQEINISNNTSTIKNIVLPDGSQLELAKNTSVSYKRNFSYKRNIKLNGQALFSVNKNQQRPFTVQTKLGEIRALGTQFSVKAFENNDFCKIYLIEGSVSVSNSINEILLKPGQEALITSNNSAITVIEVNNPQHAMAWKTGIYIFEDESLTNILNIIADAHNKKLSINSLNAINKHYSVKFIRGEDLSTMLEVLADICPMGFRITQNEIIIDEK